MQIVLTSVSKTFSYRTILKELQFSFTPGRTFIEGENGVGKTTLLKIIGGLTTPSSGTIVFSDPKTPKVSYFANDWGLYGTLSVEENLSYIKSLHGFSTDVASVLDCWNLSSFARTSVRTLSSGQRARVGLAASFLSDMELYLFDEPTAYLDQENRTLFFKAIKLIPKDSIVIMTGHDTEELKKQCDTTVKLTAQGLMKS